MAVASSVPNAGFSYFDWTVVGVYLLMTTIVGARLAGKQATIRDFFLAGRRLPWWAICGSIVATEISAATFVSLPAVVFAAGGNMTFLQLAIGSVLARVIIGVFFVPRFFEQEIYSPYDFMGRRLGEEVKRATTGLFFVGAILGQGARVYITSYVVSVIAGVSLPAAIILVGVFSVLWTLLGGMTTVIWTDVIQFGVLLCGALAAVAYAVTAVPGGLDEVLTTAGDAGKFALLDLRADLAVAYTLWCGLFATPFLNLAAFGTDQVMAQRMFCCRNATDARRAIIVSSISLIVTFVMLFTGAALYVYFKHQPFGLEEADLYAQNNTYLLPIFIVRALPEGLRGLIVAAVFATAVSTLDSTLAALSQSTLSAFVRFKKRAPRRGGRLRGLFNSEIAMSRGLVVLWGVVLSGFAILCILLDRQYKNSIDLALALVAYTYGPLLGIFLLAFFNTGRDDRGLGWAAPLAMLTVFALTQHGWTIEPWGLPRIDLSDWIVWGASAGFIVAALSRLQDSPAAVGAVAAGAIAAAALHNVEFPIAPGGAPRYLAWPWTYPIATIVTFTVGYAVGRPRTTAKPPRKTKTRRA